MKETQFQYKCRLCGKIDTSLCGNENIGLSRLCDAINDNKHMEFGMQVKMLDVHACTPTQCGISDLIGYKIEEIK